MKRRIGSGPHSQAAMKQFMRYDEIERESILDRVEELYDGSRTLAQCWRIALDEWKERPDLSDLMTVGQLIEQLSKMPANRPVMLTTSSYARNGEYVSIKRVGPANLIDQNASGDPSYYGHAIVVLLEG